MRWMTCSSRHLPGGRRYLHEISQLVTGGALLEPVGHLQRHHPAQHHPQAHRNSGTTRYHRRILHPPVLNRPISVYRLGEMPIQSCGQSVSAPRGKAGARLNAHTELRAKRQRSAREAIYRNRPITWRPMTRRATGGRA